MIRQAHTYLVGAVSGTALIGAAVITFVMLVSLQALKDWPLAGIGGGGDGAAVSTGQPARGAGNAASAGGGSAAAAAHAAGKGAKGTSPQHGGAGSLGGSRGGSAAGGTSPAPSGGEAPSGGAGSTPSSTPGGGSGGGSGPGGGSAGGGSGQSTSGAVTGTVDKTVSGVDQATGGTLGDTGVAEVTEETVNGVAGPESPVGKTVDKVAETTGGLLK
jgi:hypothetical protein